MTSPVSAVDITAKMERVWVFRDANYQRRWIDKPKVGATEFVRAAEVLALARQAEALQRENAELRSIMGDFIQAHIDGPGLLDCMDRAGNRYTSQFLADAISRARALLGGSEHEGN